MDHGSEVVGNTATSSDPSKTLIKKIMDIEKNQSYDMTSLFYFKMPLNLITDKAFGLYLYPKALRAALRWGGPEP